MSALDPIRHKQSVLQERIDEFALAVERNCKAKESLARAWKRGKAAGLKRAESLARNAQDAVERAHTAMWLYAREMRGPIASIVRMYRKAVDKAADARAAYNPFDGSAALDRAAVRRTRLLRAVLALSKHAELVLRRSTPR